MALSRVFDVPPSRYSHKHKQPLSIWLTRFIFQIDIGNSPLRSPVRKRPRLGSSPSFSELSPLEEQHLNALDEIEKRLTQCQQVHSPSSRKGVPAAPATANVSSGSIPFRVNILLSHSLASWNAHFNISWTYSSCFVAPGSMICSLHPSCPGLTSDSQDLIYTTNLFPGRALQYFLSRFPVSLQLLQVLLSLNCPPLPLANGDVHALCLPSVLLLSRTT